MSATKFKNPYGKYQGRSNPRVRIHNDGRGSSFTGWAGGVRAWDCEIEPKKDGPIMTGVKIVVERASGGPGSCYIEVADEDLGTLIKELKAYQKNKKLGLTQVQPAAKLKRKRVKAPMIRLKGKSEELDKF